MDTNLSSDLELRMECQNLPSLDTFSKSDPYVIAFLYDAVTREYNEIGRTETIANNNSPKFLKRIPLQYFFEEIQHLKLELWDSDSATHTKNDDFIGEVEFDLSEIVASRGSTRSLPIVFLPKHNPQTLGRQFSRQSSARSVQSQSKLTVDGKQRGQIIIGAEIVKNKSVFLNFSPSGVKIDKKDFFGKSDGFLRFYRVKPEKINDPNNNNGYFTEPDLIQTHETEVIKGTLNPVWKPIRISLASLSNGDLRAPIIVKCFDWDRNGSPDYIGEFKTNLTELVGDQLSALQTPGARPPPVTHTFTLVKPLRPNKLKPHGQIVFSNLQLEREFSFLDYIQGGMNLNLMVAIDFTGSNGHPDDEISLHYRRGLGPNAYQQAIRTIGSIVAPYDRDQMFPLYGFGAKINGTVYHCFTLSPNTEVHGVQGILDAYDNAFNNNITLSGPTNFTPVIQTATNIARSFDPQNQVYHILLIITDGIITDMDSTIDAIVEASSTALSIIIIGVGNANFNEMNVLDGDDQRLRSRSGKVASRDIVQFVEFNKFKNGHFSQLAKETLAELPQQVAEFAKLKGVVPQTPILDRPSSVNPVPSLSSLSQPMQPPMQSPNYAPPPMYAPY